MQANVKRGLQFLLTLSLLLAAALPVRAHGSTSIELPIDTPAEAHAAVIANGMVSRSGQYSALRFLYSSGIADLAPPKDSPIAS